MTNVTAFTDKATVAQLTARMLLEVEAVRFSDGEPFIFTSGWASPVYIDCRRLISFPRVRQTLVDFGISTIYREIGFEQFDTVAGGETAGIPFAAWIADRLMLPMQYVRKKPKGFGRNAQIEGHLEAGSRVLLVEDLTTDGRSKVNFVHALRNAGAECGHCFVFFYYDIFQESKTILKDSGLELHHLCTWWDILAAVKTMSRFEAKQVDEIESFLNAPHAWSKAHGGAAQLSE
ncbi:orotate phosphoribosyltransferase [Azorhizobium sp. AG788]|uniref:orotate phosphoribosyltransferase n=1 Tax=Azorhizobium sp. AG788 TaxID=2183897 RepID=UPI0031389CBB